MAKILKKAQGMDGVLLLLDDRVVIDRPGIVNFFKYGKNAKREIPISAVSEVVFTPCSMFSIGQIEIVRSGSSNDEKRAQKNVNTMKFSKKNQRSFEVIKEKIFEMINQQRR